MLATRKTRFLSVVALYLSAGVGHAEQPISVSMADWTDAGQCVGRSVDLSRFKTLTSEDAESFWDVGSLRTNDDYSITGGLTENVGKITSFRVQEKRNGIPVYGAEALVTTIATSACSPGDTCVMGPPTKTIHGKRFVEKNLRAAYGPSRSSQEAIGAVAKYFGVDKEDVSSSLDLKIYPTENTDLLVYIGNILVKHRPGDTKLFEFVIDADNLNMVHICCMAGVASDRRLLSQPLERNHTLRQRKLSRDDLVCTSCSGSSNGVTWTSNHVVCETQTLYLNNSLHTTTCITGMDGSGNQIYGPSGVPDLFWEGVYDCKGTTEHCVLVPFSGACNDALSDVQFVAIQTLQFLRDHLGLMGGLHDDSSSPEYLRAFVHYDDQYCNAFFQPHENTLHFGDCNCKRSGSLVSVDLVAHEIMHGVTWHSSKLAYGYQAGGMGEAFGDILGTVMEFVIDDPKDPPDFTIGEPTGRIMRNMERPGLKGGIETVCEYNRSISVHKSSGPVNKAFVKSVRACEIGGCASSLKECTLLLGQLFLYSNIHRLTTFSGYVDAAEATCNTIEEWILARNLDTFCSSNQLKSFVQSGWGLVNIDLDMSTCKATEKCSSEEGQGLFAKVSGTFKRYFNCLKDLAY